jgi:hypothetical protein
MSYAVSQMQPWPFIDKKNKTLQAGKSVPQKRRFVTIKRTLETGLTSRQIRSTGVWFITIRRTLETGLTSWQVRSAGAQDRNHKANAGSRVYKRANPFRRSAGS